MLVSYSKRAQYLAQKKIKISCIIPVLNEALSIEPFLKTLKKQLMSITHLFEILVIDDGSTDNTPTLVSHLIQKNKHIIKMIRFSRNFGKEHAIAAGLKYCEGDIALLIDADFQHPIELIPDFLKKWTEGYDMVYGLQEDRPNQSKMRRLFSQAFYKLLRISTKIKIPENAGDFRLIDRAAIDSLNNCQERTRFMKGLYAWIGYRSAAIRFKANERFAGKSQHHYRQLTELALTGFISFSDIPLRIWGLIGLVISSISFFSIFYIVMDTWIHGTSVPGYATIMVTIVFFGGIQLLSIGILGEYIARIFQEVKQRPPYVIEKIIGFPVNNENSQ